LDKDTQVVPAVRKKQALSVTNQFMPSSTELKPILLSDELAQRYTEILITKDYWSRDILSYCRFLLDDHNQVDSRCTQVIGGGVEGQRVTSLFCRVPNCAECPMFRQSPSKS
jgi:hypothetical protein